MRIRTLRRLTWFFIGATLAGCLVGILVPAGLGWDFANFYDAGRRAAAGQIGDIYDETSLIGGAPPQGQMRFWGTPISAFFYAPLAMFPPGAALIVFKIQNVLAYSAALGLLFAFYRRFSPAGEQATWTFAALLAGLALWYQPFWTVFRVGGQTTATVLLLMVAGLILHTRGRVWGSAVCVAVAALMKPALAPAGLCLFLIAGISYAMTLLAVFGAAGLLSLILLGWPVHQAFLDRVLHEGQASFAWYHNSSLSTLGQTIADLPGLAASPALGTAVGVAVRALALGTIAGLAIGASRRAWQPAARRHFQFTLATLSFLFLSPVLWEHYLALLFPFLVYVIASSRHFTRAALVLVGAILALSLGQNLILMDWLRQQFAFDTPSSLMAIVLIKTSPLWLTLVLLWRHAGELFQSHAAPAWGENRDQLAVRQAS